MTWLGAAFDFSILRWLAGYGVRPIRFLICTLVILVLGAGIFSRPGAVTYTDPLDQLLHWGQPLQLDWLQAAQVSLATLVPIETPGQNEWTPSDRVIWHIGPGSPTFAFYATLQRMAGWVLVPVGIAVAAAAFRRERPSTE
jgi:hypothetical protein